MFRVKNKCCRILQGEKLKLTDKSTIQNNMTNSLKNLLEVTLIIILFINRHLVGF